VTGRRRAGPPREAAGAPSRPAQAPQHSTATITHKPDQHNSYTPADRLTGELLPWALEQAADTALAANTSAVVIGIIDDVLAICTDGCCFNRPDALVVVPDVLVIELTANGYPDLPAGPIFARNDGRRVHVFRSRA
jgi:hypothetical protein